MEPCRGSDTSVWAQTVPEETWQTTQTAHQTEIHAAGSQRSGLRKRRRRRKKNGNWGKRKRFKTSMNGSTKLQLLTDDD
jgi:hypothetical protein